MSYVSGTRTSSNVISYGSSLERDYHGAVTAGLEARLVRRQGEWSDGAVRKKGEDLEGVTVVSSLEDIVREVQGRNASA